tara:strand:+ start:343 stop:675 length:333 start_codon:yes stop_codon:yes gene_type:complete
MGILQEFNINELAGATGLILGALGGLLAVIWKSKCHCKMNLCYICQCERLAPPEGKPEEEHNTDEEEAVLPPSTTDTPATTPRASAPPPAATLPPLPSVNEGGSTVSTGV